MRPVNLIPAEDRRGEHAPMRSGPVVYIAVGALVAALAGVTALVLTNNQIVDRKGEVTRLEQQDAAVKVRAQRFAAYTQFHALSGERVSTVTSLADSRFDWSRVLHELSLVLPGDVWLTSLTGTASPAVTIGSGSSGGGGSSSGSSLRGSVPGPALEISGCAKGQDGVAGFVTALKDIDGVTRVGVQSSALPAVGSGAGTSSGSGAGASSSGASDCRTRGFIAQFQIVAAFDAAPIPSTSASATTAPAVPATGSTTPTPSSGTTTGSSSATPTSATTPAGG